MLHQRRLARWSQLPPQSGAWFGNSPLQFSSMRSGELLHAGTTASTPVRALSLPRRTTPPVSAVPRLPCLWARLPCLRQRHAGRERSRVRGERRVGGQLLRVRRHHRGEVEHERPLPLGSHEGHCRGDDRVQVVSLLLCLFRGPSSTPQVSDGHEKDKGIRGRPFRTKISLDTSISRTSISGRREY